MVLSGGDLDQSLFATVIAKRGSVSRRCARPLGPKIVIYTGSPARLTARP
jgi:hypothetical protein